jgi:hypothetical protein
MVECFTDFATYRMWKDMITDSYGKVKAYFKLLYQDVNHSSLQAVDLLGHISTTDLPKRKQ